MTKKEIIEKLKSMFIERFGDDERVLSEPIRLSDDWQSGACYLSKIRYNRITKQFEWYKEYWNYGWQTTQGEINKHAIRIFSDVLGIKISSKTEYFIEQ